uniref:Uncharacterized protein n=1 Tax=Anguilla anguilla TaxID=7936 RepID=A0A0E9T087_ANGAN
MSAHALRSKAYDYRSALLNTEAAVIFSICKKTKQIECKLSTNH